MEISTSNIVMNIDVFLTKLGWGCSVGTGSAQKTSSTEGDPTLFQLSLGYRTKEQALKKIRPEYLEDASYCMWSPELTESIQAYTEGDPIDFRSVRIDLSHLTAFGQRVIKACRKIPYGKTLSYAELAAQAGSPGASRAVGSRMACNQTILVVPCHRVIGSGGKIGGFSAPGGINFKRKLLDLERG